jgi:DNA-binding response OmpR family regulator
MSIKSELKVLIVDDEPSILMSLEFLMRKEGYKVFVARDGEEAFELMEDSKPHIVILDIMMPRVDGYQVCKFIKNSADMSNTKVIFLSAKNKEEDIEIGYDFGADLYIPKPFSTRGLVKKVNMMAMGLVL